MARKYLSVHTQGMTLENWRQRMPDVIETLDLMCPVAYDMHQLGKLSERVLKYLRPILKDRLPVGPSTTDTELVIVQRIPRKREGGIDVEKLERDMGTEFVNRYRKGDVKFDEFQFTPKELVRT